MVRRVVVHLLVPLLLLPEMCAAHAHQGPCQHDPAGSDRCPHFHLRVLCCWQQPVCYSHTGQPGSGDESEMDHDADAVYLPVSVLLGWCSEQPQIALVTCELSALESIAPVVSPLHEWDSGSMNRFPFPTVLSPSSTRSLRTLPLVI